MKNILCLDFDGVICDSINECLLVAYNSYMKVEGRSAEMIVKHNLIAEDIIAQFNKHRYLVRPAKDYWILVNLLLKGDSEISHENFHSEHQGNEVKLAQYENIFFEIRSDMIVNNFDYWISMNKIYEEISDVWEKLYLKYDVFIVTNKNKMAVEAILKSNNIRIEDGRLFTKEIFKTKNDALREIAKINNKQYEEIIFIDDSPDTIKETIGEFPKSYLANWGYYENTEGIQSINKLAEIL